MAGVKLDENTETQITMVTVTGQPQGRPQNNNSDNHQSYRNNRSQRQDRRNRQDTGGPPVTECSFCGLIRDKDVPQDCLSMNFNDRHRNISNRPIWSNNCLAWLRLSLEEREKVLQNNELHCKICLRSLKPGFKGSSCNKGNHTINTGYNGM